MSRWKPKEDVLCIRETILNLPFNFWIQITEEITSFLLDEIDSGSVSLGKFKEVTDHVSVNLCWSK